MTNTKLYKIGDLAKLVNKTPRALRLYEERGLLEPRSRSEGGYRLYGPEALARIEWVDQLQTMGLSLTAISTLLSNLCDGREAKEAVSDLRLLFQKSINRIENQIVQLQNLRSELHATMTFYEQCMTCDRTPVPDACLQCSRTNDADLPVLVRGLLAITPKCPKPSKKPA